MKNELSHVTHKDCAGKLYLDNLDTWRCDKCNIGYKCIGQELYLNDVIDGNKFV